jgi:hypothetical protein
VIEGEMSMSECEMARLPMIKSGLLHKSPIRKLFFENRIDWMLP